MEIFSLIQSDGITRFESTGNDMKWKFLIIEFYCNFRYLIESKENE